MRASRTTVAFVDDHPVVLLGMAELFEEHPDFAVVGLGGEAADALDLMENKSPEILFLDLSMPGDVFAAITEITHKFPSTRILVFTAFSSVDSALRALDAGAMGFVLKGSSYDELFEAVSVVQRGEMFVTRQYATQVLNGLQKRKRAEEVRNAVRLSAREKQIVAQLLHARTNREIAATLDLSEKTVKHYMTGLMAKLRARNRLEVVIAAQKTEDFN
ncbi:response regulator transcription factor [Pelagibacterium sp.]|uniref:response regulator transcription factor n=1 Tax=Pelagibacterium sp. TaxID=1967288 RepID=UPI003BA86403